MSRKTHPLMSIITTNCLKCDFLKSFKRPILWEPVTFVQFRTIVTSSQKSRHYAFTEKKKSVIAQFSSLISTIFGFGNKSF